MGFDFAGHGISVIGPVPAGLPSPTLPTPPLEDVLQLVPAALGVFLVSFADEILTARSFAGSTASTCVPRRSCSPWARGTPPRA